MDDAHMSEDHIRVKYMYFPLQIFNPWNMQPFPEHEIISSLFLHPDPRSSGLLLFFMPWGNHWATKSTKWMGEETCFLICLHKIPPNMTLTLSTHLSLVIALTHIASAFPASSRFDYPMRRYGEPTRKITKSSSHILDLYFPMKHRWQSQCQDEENLLGHQTVWSLRSVSGINIQASDIMGQERYSQTSSTQASSLLL